MKHLATRPIRFLAVLSTALAAGLSWAAETSPPGNAFDYTRTITYTYNVDGTLKTITREPNTADVCSVTTVAYNGPAGIPSAETIDPCASASGRQRFPSRTYTTNHDAYAAQSFVLDIDAGATTGSAAVPAGVFLSSTHDPIAAHNSAQVEYDPRFGAPSKITDINGISTSVTFDAFGRVSVQTQPDGTSVVTKYCLVPGSPLDTLTLDRSAFSAGCPTLAAHEADFTLAVTFTQSQPLDTASQKMGPYVRTFFDRLGRVVRVSTESFDATTQPTAYRGVPVVADTVFNGYGAAIVQTKPYFLSSGSSTTSGSKDVGRQWTTYDTLGRPIQVDVTDVHGQAGSLTFPGYGGGVAQAVARTTFSYQGQTVVTTNDLQQVRKEEHAADGSLLRVSDHLNAQVALLPEAFGRVAQATDALGNTTRYQYDLLGNMLAELDPDKGTSQFCYDALGQLKAAQTTAMRGSTTLSTCPDDVETGTTVAVQLTTWTKIARDAAGKPTQRSEPEMSSTWTYDTYADGTTCANGADRLCESTTSTGLDRRYAYDSVGRTIKRRIDTTDGKSFAFGWTFNATTGRPSRQVYPSGLQVQYNFTGNGVLQSLTNFTALTVNPLPNGSGVTATSLTLPQGSPLWTANARGATGAVEQEAYSSGVIEATGYEGPSLRIATKSAAMGATALTNQQYTWNSIGNVTARIDNVGDNSGSAVTETFSYDDINRLTGYAVTAPKIPGFSRAVTLQYNALGQLLYKSDEGNYVYPAKGTTSHPHALSTLQGTSTVNYQVDGDGNIITASGGKYRTLGYTSFDRIKAATNGLAGAAGIQYAWLYDEAHQRFKETRTANGNTRTVYYVNPDDEGGLAFEAEFDTSPASQSFRHFLMLGGDVVGTVVTTGALPTLTATQLSPAVATSIASNKIEYWHTDHLGSLIATSDHLGNATQLYSYDPFGKRRFTDGRYDEFGSIVQDWNPALNSGTARGFTRHEQLDDIGLVNMNGRMFDAALGLFAQADAWVPHPTDLQSYGRYSYTRNNPLNAVDLNGYEDFPTDGGGGCRDLSHACVMKTIQEKNAGKLQTPSPRSDPATGEGTTYPDTVRGDHFQPQVTESAKAVADAIDKHGDKALLLVPVGGEAKAGVEVAESGLLAGRGLLTKGREEVQSVLVTGKRWTSNLVDGIEAFFAKMMRGCNCFVAGTPVLTADGLKPIEQIAVGDLVESRDVVTGETSFKPVEARIFTERESIYALTLRAPDGTTTVLKVTAEHPFKVVGNAQWTTAIALRPGMSIETLEGPPLRVVRRVNLHRTEMTFNLTVADFHTYFVGDGHALVHNAGDCGKGAAGAKSPIHHICTDKNCISELRGGPWTPRFQAIFNKAGMTLEDGLNKVEVAGHAGPHPEEYHQAVFDRLVSATNGKSGPAYREALQTELRVIGKELQTPGSILNSLVTK